MLMITFIKALIFITIIRTATSPTFVSQSRMIEHCRRVKSQALLKHLNVLRILGTRNKTNNAYKIRLQRSCRWCFRRNWKRENLSMWNSLSTTGK